MSSTSTTTVATASAQRPTPRSALTFARSWSCIGEREALRDAMFSKRPIVASLFERGA